MAHPCHLEPYWGPPAGRHWCGGGSQEGTSQGKKESARREIKTSINHTCVEQPLIQKIIINIDIVKLSYMLMLTLRRHRHLHNPRLHAWIYERCSLPYAVARPTMRAQSPAWHWRALTLGL